MTMSTSLKGMINMNRILALIACTAIGALFTAASYVTGAAHAGTGEVIRDHPVVHGAIAKATGRECPEEDSVNCYWNDGSGHALYRVRVGDRICTIYWGERYNRRHGHCAQ